MIYLPQDPAGVERLASKMQAVCASVSAGDQVTKEQLKDLAKKREKNPLNYLTKNNQSFSQTCAANAGEVTFSCLAWQRTGRIIDFSRLWLYLMGKTKWDWKSGRCNDDGCSIPSIAETLHEKGIPLESTFPFDPDASHWPNLTQFLAMQTPELIAECSRHKLTSMSPVSQDFDVTIARIAMGDPFFWGTNWSPFPSGPKAHATSGLWYYWDQKLNDFVLGMDNSHKDNERFLCTRKQYDWAMKYTVPNFGAFHMEGAVDLRFRANQLVM